MARFRQILRYSLGGALTAAGVVAGLRMTDRQIPPAAQEKPSQPAQIAHAPAVADEHGRSPEATDEAAGATSGQAAPLPRSAEVATAEGAAATPPLPEASRPDATPPAGSSASKLLQRADDLIEEGMYASALRILVPLLPQCTGDSAANARFRIGLCSELVGDVAEAQEQFDEVVKTHERSALGRQALLGQARVWNATGRRHLTCTALFHRLAQREFASSSAADDAWYLLGLSLAHITGSGSQDPLQDGALFAADPQTRVADVLAALREPPSQATEDSQSAQFVELLQRDGPTPAGVLLRVSQSQQPVQDVLAALTSAAGWTLHVSEAAAVRCAGRSASLHCDRADAAFLLDAALAELELGWKFDGGAVRVFDLKEVPAGERDLFAARQSAEVLQQALVRAPAHRWACPACVALTRLAALMNQPHEALRLSQQAVDQFPRGECRAEIWLNRGKLLLASGDREGALRAFYYAVDSVDSHPLKPVGYLYVGRLHLENGESDKAVPALMRALALAEKTPLEPTAAGMLSSAFLLDRNPHGANAVLMKRRNLLSAGPLSDQAAMLSALARFDGAVEPDRRRREAAALVESLAHVRPDAMFGGHWWCLVVDGFRKTGMMHEADRLRDECLRCTAQFPLRDRLLLSAIESRVRTATEPRTGDALRVFAGMQTAAVHDDVRLLDARTAYRQGLHDAALDRCEKLVRDTSASDEARREALRLMGRIYQKREDYKSAVACYAGLLPAHPTPIDRLGLHPGAGGTP